MRWPWTLKEKRDSLVVSWTGSTLSYVQARRNSDGLCQVTRFGVEYRGADGLEDFFHRIQALGLSAHAMHVVLRPEQYQLLQIEAPQVPAEEIRSAARWKIKELVSTHLDDLTLDVMRVGDDRVRAAGQLFVVVARNALVRELLELGEKLRCPVQVIDVHDTAQRNLQSLLARKEGSLDRANAALVIVSSDLAMLTISAHEELFYSRRIELGQGFVESRWLGSASAGAPGADAFSSVPEYVPEYVPGGSSLEGSYAHPYGGMPSIGAASAVSSIDETAQRFVVEVQRSLDLWERTWSSVPLEGVKVFAGARSQELAQWLSQELGHSVVAMNVDPYFPGFDGGSDADRSLCWPLLGALLRSDA